MNKEQLIDYITHGREMEFCHNGKNYSITYGMLNGKRVISFCEFGKASTEVELPEELLHIKREGLTVLEMLNSIDDKDIWIF